MKLLFRITVLALAAVGARTLFERFRPRVSGATGAGNVVGETLAPAVRDAAANVKQASTQAVQDAAAEVKQASSEAVQDVMDATRQAAEEIKDGTGPGAAPGSVLATDATGRGPVGDPALEISRRRHGRPVRHGSPTTEVGTGTPMTRAPALNRVRRIPPQPTWYADAPCRGKGRLFYPPPNEPASERALRERVAAVVCAGCDAKLATAGTGRGSSTSSASGAASPRPPAPRPASCPATSARSGSRRSRRRVSGRATGASARWCPDPTAASPPRPSSSASAGRPRPRSGRRSWPVHRPWSRTVIRRSSRAAPSTTTVRVSSWP